MTNIYGQCIKIWRSSCLHLWIKVYLLLSNNLCKVNPWKFFFCIILLRIFSFLKLCFIFMEFCVLWARCYFGMDRKNYDLRTKTRFSQFLLLRLFNLVLSLNIIMYFCASFGRHCICFNSTTKNKFFSPWSHGCTWDYVIKW
jgi:hypothetical protein